MLSEQKSGQAIKQPPLGEMNINLTSVLQTLNVWMQNIPRRNEEDIWRQRRSNTTYHDKKSMNSQ